MKLHAGLVPLIAVLSWGVIAVVIDLFLKGASDPCTRYREECQNKPSSVECKALCGACCIDVCNGDPYGACSQKRCREGSSGQPRAPQDCYVESVPKEPEPSL